MLWSGERQSEIQRHRRGHHAPVKKVDFVLQVMMDLQFRKISAVLGKWIQGLKLSKSVKTIKASNSGKGGEAKLERYLGGSW